MKKRERLIPPVTGPDGMTCYESVTSPPDDSIAVCVKVPNRIIPVIFVPGIMGTNLSNLAGDETVWSLDSEGKILLSWAAKNAKTRKALLDPDQTRVSGDGKIPGGTKQTEAELRRRGWGEVSYISYGAFLVWLENALDDATHATTGLRAELMSRAVSDDPSVQPLTYDEVALSYKYLFPVYAVGYNWLQSNADSASRLDEKVNEIMAYHTAQGKRCEYVILLTHSMGGLVARYYTMCLDEDGATVRKDKPVLGVVHGVMPATGAAATYKRMKTGTEGVLSALVLGKSAAETVPVFAQSPGPLELLPSPDYGRGWLKIRDEKQSVQLPQSRNVYDEIYTERDKWWGLCEDFRIDASDRNKWHIERDWVNYVKLIKNVVEDFHRKLSEKYHPNTYAFYGDDPAKKTWGGGRVAKGRRLSSFQYAKYSRG